MNSSLLRWWSLQSRLRIAVTGGSGFIGERLLRKLSGGGHDILSVDIREPKSSRGDYQFVKADLTESDQAQSSLNGCDVVYHLAGVVLEGVRNNPYDGSALNVDMTRNVVEACRRLKVRKVIFASSFYVYDGIPPELIVNEESPLNTLQMELFGVTKVFGETLLKEYNRKFGLEFVILRFGSAYGLGDCTNVVKTFLEAAWRGQTLEVWGHGRRRNQYTYIDDIAEGCALALQSTNETFNLISPDETSISEVANEISRRYGREVVYRRDKAEGASMPYMSSRKAIKNLGWSPIPLRSGVDKMVEERSQVQCKSVLP